MSFRTRVLVFMTTLCCWCMWNVTHPRAPRIFGISWWDLFHSAAVRSATQNTYDWSREDDPPEWLQFRAKYMRY